MPVLLGEGPRFYSNPRATGPDLVGGLGHERGVRGRSVGPANGAGGSLVVARLKPGGDIKIGDPGFDPGAPTMKRRLTRGLHGLNELSSAAILTTPRGVQAVGGHFINVVDTLDPDALTTPTWMAAPFIFNRLKGDRRSRLRGQTAETVARRGVQIVNGVLEKTGSDATMLLSVRPTADTVTGDGILSEKETKEMYKQLLPWLVEEAEKTSRQYVVFLETESRKIGAKVFAEVARDLNVPYAVSVRPNDKGEMPDGSSYGDVAEAIDSDLLAFAGVGCNTIGLFREAMRLASRQSGAEIFTLYAAPNGVEGLTESHDGLTREEASRIRAENIRGVKRLREEFGTVVFAGCCGSTAENVKSWRRELEEDSALNGTVSERRAGNSRYLVYEGAR